MNLERRLKSIARKTIKAIKSVAVGTALAFSFYYLMNVEAQDWNAGELYEVDSIVGNMRYIPPTGPEGFVQGSPVDEHCRSPIGEDQEFKNLVISRNSD